MKNPLEPNIPKRKARVVNTYPAPSRWLIVQYEDGNMDQVEESQITTMIELNRQGREI